MSEQPDPKPSDIRDVARRAGVSVGTVSNVFNHPEKVTSATRARVQAAASAVDYTPNEAARALRLFRRPA